MAELIVALDLENASKALRLAKSLEGLVNWYKVGLELFIAQGPEIVRQLKHQGARVFLDLKLYDIPNTVAAAVRSACRLDADILSLHCQGGRRMCEIAIQAAQEASAHPPLLFGVTALTSFADGEMPGISIPTVDYALELAALADAWALPGIVCSGFELPKIKSLFPRLLCLCPGIRPQAAAKSDQRRVVSPSEAVKAGADFLVVGRPISQAPNPAKAAAEILAGMNSA